MRAHGQRPRRAAFDFLVSVTSGALARGKQIVKRKPLLIGSLLIAAAFFGAGHPALGQPEEVGGVSRTAQCPTCEGQVQELEGELVSDEGVPVTLAEGDEVIMSYRTSDGTARAGEDYVETTGTLTFTVQEPNPLIRVETLEDELNESDEFFTVTLLPAELPDGSRTDRLDKTLSILDNDGLTATVSAEQTVLEEGEPAGFRVELGGGISTAPVAVEYVVAGDSTVTAGEDYEEPSGRMTIAAGAAEGVFTVMTLDDDVLERDEWMAVQLPEECCSSAGSVKPGRGGRAGAGDGEGQRRGGGVDRGGHGRRCDGARE